MPELSPAKIVHELTDALSGVRSASPLGRLLRELLTPSEVAAVRRRWGILTLLHEGCSQREVARQLRCSLCNVTRGARVLRRSDSAVRALLEAGQPAPAAPKRSRPQRKETAR